MLLITKDLLKGKGTLNSQYPLILGLKFLKEMCLLQSKYFRALCESSSPSSNVSNTAFQF